MILRTELKSSTHAGLIPAWEAVARTQKANSARYLLIRQPDHARLAGQIVERFAIPGASAVDDDIVQGVSLHDEGWADFDCGRKRLEATPAVYSEDGVALNAEGKPLSFLEIKAGDFLQAWRGSIESAEAVAPVAGLIVSAHFRRIGQFGMGLGTYSQSDEAQVREFIAQEEQRRRRLMRLQERSEKEVEYWTDVLQFCDLLSLYLCCGLQESVEFPQRIAPKGQTITLRVNDGINKLSPPIFASEMVFELEANPYPSPGGSPARLSWRVM